jgi:hypothetical protein
MGQLIIPEDTKFKGPWLLDNKSLEDLAGTLKTIEAKIQDAYLLAVERTAEEKLEEYRKSDSHIDIEKAKEKVKNSYSFEKSEKFVILISKEGKKLRDESLIEILKDPKLADLKPTELLIEIVKGPCEFKLEVSSKFYGELQCRVKVEDDNSFNDINYEINKWINNYRPSKVMKKWMSWFPWAAFPVFVILLMLTPLLIRDAKDIYKSKLAEESREILKDGVTEQEALKAIDILLQLQTGYVPENFNPNIQPKKYIGFIWLFAILALVVLSIRPKTIIGLGKNKWKVTFYKRWAYFVLIFVPLFIILPIIINKIS